MSDPNEPTHKMVNGELVALTDAEIKAIKKQQAADAAAARDQREDERDAKR